MSSTRDKSQKVVSKVNLPEILINQIKEGKAVLFLGAGSSLCCVNDNGDNMPTSKELAMKLSKKFLAGKYDDFPLSQVSELAISECDLFTVQDFIREIFEGYKPSDSHLIMPLFKWWGIVTTNFDRLIESAYEKNKSKSCQKPVPFIENGDRVEDKLRDSNHVPLLKLHGCISRISNKDCPLILSTDQYIEHRKGRSRIFEMFKEWAYERPIIFIGSSLQDPDIRTILLEVSQLGEARHRYYVVIPNADNIQTNFWGAKKITVINGIFLELMTTLDQEISSPFRVAIPQKQYSHPIYERFKSNEYLLSENCFQFLNVDAEYVKSATSQNIVAPKDFYKGYNPGWAAVEQNLDVRRDIVDRILEQHFIVEASESERLNFILIKGHAGSGKTVLLRRVAWDATHLLDCLCIYMRQNGRIDASAIQELANYCGERIFLFIDNVADRVGEISRFVDSVGIEGKKITIIGCERINEWNISGEPIADIITQDYELHYLSPREILKLISLLQEHKALGTLEGKKQDERVSAFEARAGRQLLVALHEATLGRPFEDIIEDEYNNVKPEEAQLIYLTICTLNRLNVPVRAGIISRLHGIPFAEFKRRLFAPLEMVVHATYSNQIRDYIYEARHPHIAEIVFERILKNPEEKFDKFIKCLKELNIDYNSDRKAFRQMVRAKTLIELFPSHEHVKMIYKDAELIARNDTNLLQQMAIYEMNRQNGNLEDAFTYLNKALSLSQHDLSLIHSFAELNLRRADKSRTELEKDAFLKEAISVAYRLIKEGFPESQYGYHTLIKAYLERITLYISKPEYEQSVIENLIVETEKALQDGLQQYPENSHLLEADSQLASLLSDSTRAVQSLSKAFNSNPRNTFVALRLSSHLIHNGEFDSAKELLEKSLNANPNEKRIHFAYAKLLIHSNESSGEKILYHLVRSFTPGDKNYMAQILYGRQLFTNGDISDSKQFFEELRGRRSPPDLRNKLQYSLNKVFAGEIVKKEMNYCFIQRDGIGDHIFAHMGNTRNDVWEKLKVGMRIYFKIAFTLGGPNAYEIEIIY